MALGINGLCVGMNGKLFARVAKACSGVGHPFAFAVQPPVSLCARLFGGAAVVCDFRAVFLAVDLVA